MSEKELLRGFIGQVAEFMDELFAEPNRGVGAELQKGVRSARRVSGLRQAASDMVEWTVDLSPAHVEQLDARLERMALPTLSQMRDRRYRDAQRILSSKKLRSEDDYRLLEQLLSDTANISLSETDVRRANELLAAFSKVAPGA